MEANKKICCNCCGKEYEGKGTVVEADFLDVKKQWGYFSKKDGIVHEFSVCEICYDKWLEKFAIFPEERKATELI